MTKRLVERRKLLNGLFLEFWDESRKLAGDRWYVGVRAAVPVPVPENPPEGISPDVIQLIQREKGHYSNRNREFLVNENRSCEFSFQNFMIGLKALGKAAPCCSSLIAPPILTTSEHGVPIAHL